jgi:hypothetical protein
LPYTEAIWKNIPPEISASVSASNANGIRAAAPAAALA